MPRTSRGASESEYYHLVSRGITRQTLYEDDRDYAKGRELVRSAFEGFEIDLCAYCLMPNHFHLLGRGQISDISQAMRHCNAMYAQWFNSKYDRTGPLFQGRFYSEAIKSDEQALAALRYILRNPEKAGLSSMKEYEWSSFRDIERGEASPALQTLQDLAGGRDALMGFLAEDFEGRFFDVPAGRLTDESLRGFIRNELGMEPEGVADLGKADRDGALKRMREEGYTIARVERVTGISRGIVQRAKPSR